MKKWILAIGFGVWVGGGSIGSVQAQPSALTLGYCASDFDVCYNSCRISHPEPSFAADRARVICGQNCFKQRQQCEARAGGVVRAVPQPIEPLSAPQAQQPQQRQAAPATTPAAAPRRDDLRRAYPRPGTVQQAPAGVAGSAPVQAKRQQAPVTSSRVPQAETTEKESGFLGWFKRPEKKKSVIPGKR
ncbi:MAG: hypothetical protein VW802_07690 [Rhodospirillaceae bacterium]